MKNRVCYELYLPLPPSVNQAYGNNYNTGKGRFLTTKARNWYRDAGLILQSQFRFKPPVIEKHIQVQITCAGVDYRSDLDNRNKLLIDLLVKCEIIADDRWIDDLHIRRLANAQIEDFKPIDSVDSTKCCRVIINGLTSAPFDNRLNA